MGTVLQGERRPTLSLSLGQNPAPSPEPEIFRAQKWWLKVLLSKILQPRLFISPFAPFLGVPFSVFPFWISLWTRGNQTLGKHVLHFSLLFIFMCRLSLAPPASHLSLPFLCSPLLTFLLVPLPKISSLLRMGSPPLGPTLHCVTHRLNIFITSPLGKTVIDGISIYLHFLCCVWGKDDGFK